MLLFVIILVICVRLFFKINSNAPVTYVKEKRLKKVEFKGFENNKFNSQNAQVKIKSISIQSVLLLIVFCAGCAIWEIGNFSFSSSEYLFVRGFFLFSVFVFCLQVAMSFFCSSVYNDRDFNLNVDIVVPVYNENQDSLRTALLSHLQQTVLPETIYVVNDGSNVDYSDVKKEFIKEARQHNVKVMWINKRINNGKREAQITAFYDIFKNGNLDNKIIMTTDSDTVLNADAIENGIMPFKDQSIMSVAGLMISKNRKGHLLASIYDVILVCQQIVIRGALSVFSSVTVNSGPIAFYRSIVIQNAVTNGYNREYLFGKKVICSDDSYLTLCALMMGKTRFQPNSIGLSDMPIKLSHHIKQQLRWFRGSVVRGLWRLKYLPVLSVGFLRQFLGMILFYPTIIIVYFEIASIIVQGVHNIGLLALFFGFSIFLTFMFFSNYFIVTRDDLPRKFNNIKTLGTIFLAIFWVITVIKVLAIYAAITFWKVGEWGTRKNVEAV